MNAVTFYSYDFHDLLPPNPDNGTTTRGYTWCAGNAGGSAADEFNPDLLRDPTRTLVAPYLNFEAELFRCTADSRLGRYSGAYLYPQSNLIGKNVPAARTISMSQAHCATFPSLRPLNAAPGGVAHRPYLAKCGALRHALGMLTLERFSCGVGDRFGHEAKAQLRAFQMLAKDGVDVTPVWNKSNREHTFIGSEPQSVLVAAEAAVKALGWKQGWHVDADHIRLETVDRFIPWSDFFTIDVADFIGKPTPAELVRGFIDRHPELIGKVNIKGLTAPILITRAEVERVTAHYLTAVQEAARIYRHILEKKGEANIIAEVSMDETETPQTPPELLIILVLLAEEKVRAQTVAPKFTGRFNKGVDYVGDLAQFQREFNDDLAVIAHAISTYGLPNNLKLSVHSGSDKFSLYPIIRRALARTGAGVHLKTAGTTWLEELIGLSEAGGDGLQLTKEIYSYALAHVDELCAPYASVIDIDRAKLPTSRTVNGWSGPQLANALRHIPNHPEFNPHVRQLLHVSFKLAAKAGARYLDLLKTNESIVARQVTENLYQRHLKPLFLGE